MKNILCFLVLGFVLISCNKDFEKMEVIRDCTGDYLRSKNGKDFLVCNEDVIAGFSTGTKIKVSYDKLNECFGILEPPACNDSHLYESKIEILEIQ